MCAVSPDCVTSSRTEVEFRPVSIRFQQNGTGLSEFPLFFEARRYRATRTGKHLVEVTPKKKIVWALSSWKDPDLGPATSIQLLDQPGNPDVLGQER